MQAAGGVQRGGMMPRETDLGRPPTVDDLTPDQRRIDDEIRSEEVQQLYLNSLPPIRETAASRRQVEQIRRRLQVLGDLQRYGQEEAERLLQLLPHAERGRTLNLNKEFAPPTLAGVLLRFARY